MKFLILTATIIISFGLTQLVRKSAIKRNKFDIPNERSSHKNPTPRGGGLAGPQPQCPVYGGGKRRPRCGEGRAARLISASPIHSSIFRRRCHLDEAVAPA